MKPAPGVFHVSLDFTGNAEHAVFVYSTSHLGLGAHAARERYVKLLQDSYAQQDESDDQDAGIIGGVGADVLVNISSPCFLEGHRPDPPVRGMAVVGSGGFDECVADLRTHGVLGVASLQPCHAPPCRLGDVAALGVDLNSVGFLGISEFWYSVWDVFGVKSYEPGTLWPLAREFCSMPHSLVLDAKESGRFPHADVSRLEQECFKLAWIAVVLHDGYGIAADSALDKAVAEREGLPAIQISMQIGSEEVSWTLGALLVHLAGMDDGDGRGHHLEHSEEVFKPGHVHQKGTGLRRPTGSARQTNFNTALSLMCATLPRGRWPN